MRYKGISIQTTTDTQRVSVTGGVTKFFQDETQSDEGSQILNATEADLLALVQRTPDTERNLRVQCDLNAEAVFHYEVEGPVVRDTKTRPGDIDILAVNPNSPNRATAFQAKVVRFCADDDEADRAAKLAKLDKLVLQIRGTMEMGFHRVYGIVLVSVDARKRKKINHLARGARPSSTDQVTRHLFNGRVPFPERAGLVFLSIIQPTGRSFLDARTINVDEKIPAKHFDQDPSLTARIEHYLRET